MAEKSEAVLCSEGRPSDPPGHAWLPHRSRASQALNLQPVSSQAGGRDLGRDLKSVTLLQASETPHCQLR